MTTVKLFGREPALWATLIESVVLLVTTFGLDLTQNQIGAINGLVSVALGLYIAYVTHETMGAALISFVKATLAFATAFAFTITDTQQTQIILVATVICGFFQRTQVTPIENKVTT